MAAEAFRPKFSDRETRVVKAFLDGSSEHEIASRLGLTEEQVFTAVRHAMAKLEMYVKLHRLNPPERGADW